jgi:UDP-sulfoquinovose synthase
MRVLITGVDGYLGWPLAQHLTSVGHEVGGVDLFLRRDWVEEMGGHSATPIRPMSERLEGFRERYGIDLPFWNGDLREYDFVDKVVREFAPDAIVHLGECPSAPYSMIDVHHATFAQMNNVVGTMNLLFAIQKYNPSIHLVKLGSMGEYGTPKIDIPEGFFEVDFRGRKARLPFPRLAGSWYHWSKVHGSNNIMFACKIWGLRSTDVMQGVVFGTYVDDLEPDERLMTRLDFDQSFGTAINRFCCQAVIGHPITPYGKGHQQRGFLPLKDSMRCLTIAIENPPAEGEYRVFNQFAEVYDITQLAQIVQDNARSLGMDVEIQNIVNPRLEDEEHYYNPDHQNLLDLGYEPTRDVRTEVRHMLQHLQQYRDRIEAKRQVLIPDVRWNGKRQKVDYLPQAAYSGQYAEASNAGQGEED